MAKALFRARFKVTRVFFNSAIIQRKVDSATIRVLSKFGAFVRQTARSSIRKRRRSSPPGQPPSSHTGLLRRRILFWFDLVRRSVIIGPELARKQGDQILRALEQGGLSRPAKKRATPGHAAKPRGRKRFVRARPFMGPALNKNLPLLPLMWRESVKR